MKSYSNYVVNIGAIRHNIGEFKKINGNVKICGVVKADGYGHGIKNFVPKIDCMLDAYGVATAKEAIRLRKHTQKPILVLNFVEKKDLVLCAKNKITISVFCMQHLLQIEQQNIKIDVHLAINSGMNRIGIGNIDEFFDMLNFCKTHCNICIKGIFTHFYNAKNSNDVKHQICIFNQFLQVLDLYYDTKKLCVHTSASEASIKHNFCFDMVRLGILMYGYLEQKCEMSLRPALSVTSKIINITHIKKGQSVGYGKAFVAQKNMKIATVPLGYADGIFRSYAKSGKVIINGKYSKIVGNICMDMFMCDVTNTNCRIGDKVTLLGTDGKKSILASDIARATNTICYEVLTNIKQNRMNIVCVDD